MNDTKTPSVDDLASVAASIHESAKRMEDAAGKLRDDNPNNDAGAVKVIFLGAVDIGSKLIVLAAAGVWVWQNVVAPAFG